MKKLLTRAIAFILTAAVLVSSAFALTVPEKLQVLNYSRFFISTYCYESDLEDDPLEKALTAVFDSNPQFYFMLLQYMPSGENYSEAYPGGPDGESRYESFMEVVAEEQERGFENAFGLALAAFFAARPAMFELVMTAMLGSYDQYTRYIPAGKYSSSFSTAQDYVGIGVSVTSSGGGIVVTSVAAGGPAAEAGVRPGDVIYSVGGILAEGAPLEELTSRMKGEEGTAVNLVVMRDGVTVSFDIVRRKINVSNISSYEENGALIIKISGFSEGDDEDMRLILEKAEAAGMPVIIDLRDCPGGSMSVMEKILSMLIIGREHVLTYRTRGDYGYDEERVITSGETVFTGPLCLVVNERSASAAEMMAAALSEQERAYIVGTSTYGKFRAQYHLTFDDDSAIVVTSIAILTANGEDYEGIGLAPDLTVKNGTAEPSYIREISLNRGNCSDDAEALNRALLQLGLLEKMPEKYYRFGDETAAALRIFCSYYGLEQTSGLTEECARVINSVLAALGSVESDEQLRTALELVSVPAM